MEEEVKKPAKCWGVFRRIGSILGKVSLFGSIIFLGLFVGEAGIVFTILGKHAEGYNDCIDKKSLVFNIVGLVVSIIWYFVFIVIIALS